MGVVAIHSLRTLPGGHTRHVAAAEEARRRLQVLGLDAATLLPVAGDFAGQIATAVLSADHADWAAGQERVRKEPSWNSWCASIADEGFAEEVESSAYVDLDPTFATFRDLPVGALSMAQWRPRHGRFADLVAGISRASPHIERLGGHPRVLQCINGPEPLTLTVIVTFTDLVSLGEHNDKLACDEQWSALWTSFVADPPARLVRAGTFIVKT